MNIQTPNRRQAKQQLTRERLLDSAMRVFARRGYHAATLEEVAADAGLSTGAVYSNFAGKEDLFLTLTDREVAKRVEEIGAVLASSDSPDALEREAGGQFARFIRDDPHWPLLFFEFFAYGARNEHLRDQFTTRRRAVQGAIAHGLQERAAASSFELPLPAEQIAVGIGALINGLAFERVIDPESVPDELFGLMLSRLITALFSAPPGAGS